MREVAIQEITNNLDSKRVPLNSSQREEKESNPLYPYIGANNIMGYIDEYIFDEKILCIAEDGGSWGYQETCAKIYDEKVWVNNHAHVLTAKENLVLEYLMYYMNYADLSLHINGATRGKLTKSSLNSIKIPLPPLPQQKKIAAILDAADAYRQKTKALIAKYDELTQSLFLDMFGDPVTNPKGCKVLKGNELFKFSSGKYNPTKNLSDEYEYPTYGGNGITGYSEDYLIDFSTIVVGRVGAYCGSIHHTEGKTWITDNAIYIKEFKQEVNLIYTFYFMRGYKLNRFADFSGQPKITQMPLENMSFIYPELQLQNQFAERVQAIEAQKAQAQKSLAKAEDLFNSLLQRAFKGELV